MLNSPLYGCRMSKTIELPPYPRGSHVITRPLLQRLPEIVEFEVGLANFFIKVCTFFDIYASSSRPAHTPWVVVAPYALQHTSASLTINENASPDVPLDLADALDRLAPEGNQSGTDTTTRGMTTCPPTSRYWCF